MPAGLDHNAGFIHQFRAAQVQRARAFGKSGQYIQFGKSFASGLQVRQDR
jgi:hypothetical protein